MTTAREPLRFRPVRSEISGAVLGRATNVTITVAVALERLAPAWSEEERAGIAKAAGDKALELLTGRV